MEVTTASTLVKFDDNGQNQQELFQIFNNTFPSPNKMAFNSENGWVYIFILDQNGNPNLITCDLFSNEIVFSVEIKIVAPNTKLVFNDARQSLYFVSAATSLVPPFWGIVDPITGNVDIIGNFPQENAIPMWLESDEVADVLYVLIEEPNSPQQHSIVT